MSLTAEQLEMRKTGIGASEAAAACGLSKYQQTVELYMRKIGEAPDEEETKHILFGNHMEAGGVRYWEALRKKPVEYPMPTVRHPEHSFMLSTPDGKIGPRHGLEFKTMDFFRFKLLEKEGITNVIPDYVLQCQQQMACMDWDVITIAIMVGKDLHDIEVERNDRLINLIVERESIFWDHVTRRMPPDVDFSQEGALRAVKSLHPEIKTGDVVQLDEETTAMWEAYTNAGRQIKELESQRNGWKAAVLAAIGDNFAGLLAGGEKMIRRKVIAKKGYSVDAHEYVDARLVNYDGSPVIEGMALLAPPEEPEPDEVETDATADVVRRIDFRLREAGFLLVDTSVAGSRYYLHKTEPKRVRLADHPPNEKTRDWMNRQGIVSEIRFDKPDALERTGEIIAEVEPELTAA